MNGCVIDRKALIAERKKLNEDWHATAGPLAEAIVAAKAAFEKANQVAEEARRAWSALERERFSKQSIWSGRLTRIDAQLRNSAPAPLQAFLGDVKDVTFKARTAEQAKHVIRVSSMAESLAQQDLSDAELDAALAELRVELKRKEAAA